MTKAQLLKKLAILESVNDQLITELAYVDRVLSQIGFEQGVRGLKAAALLVIEHSFQDQL